ncbi:hypothetical protein [Streptomyces sp. NPDC004270]
MEDVGHLLADARVPVLELTQEEATLEQAYLDLTSAEAECTAARHQEA